ncbi:hypothetical protein SDJN02_07118, partial [Cucurbita argyrosperma subsp. argyrosperma]
MIMNILYENHMNGLIYGLDIDKSNPAQLRREYNYLLLGLLRNHSNTLIMNDSFYSRINVGSHNPPHC